MRKFSLGAKRASQIPLFKEVKKDNEKIFPPTILLPGKARADWKFQMRNRITSPDGLFKAVPKLARRSKMWKEGMIRAGRLYRMAITPYYLSLIDFSNPEDPIAKQAIPSGLETITRTWEREDPLDEEADSQVIGLTHRYPDRALMVTTNLCAMYCRHCTRKRKWKNPEGHASRKKLGEMLEYLKKTQEITDVIISGGDPLILPLNRLREILTELRKIPHIEIIRIGTRVPVVLPQRIDEALLEILDGAAPIWLNTQFNHPREITEESAEACEKILKAGIPVSNQTVLLRGVNDCPEIMSKLCKQLLKIRVRPYYLYQCDPVKGVGHFRTSVGEGIRIIEYLRGHISGIGIPTFVIDAPGGAGKIPVAPNYLLFDAGSYVVLRNYEGVILRYNNPPPKDHSCCSVCTGGTRRGVASIEFGENTELIPEGTTRIMKRRNNAGGDCI